MNDKATTPAPPAVHDPNINQSMALIGRHASPALQIMLDPALFDRAKLIATYMARAEGMIPRHLIGKTEACFAVVVRSITWKLDPFAVATCTYQTPGGSVGFEGKLCQAVLENSGKLEGPIRFIHYGDWSQVQGKFEVRKSAKGNDYAVPTWTDANAKGLGVTVSAKVVGEPEPREWSFDLIQAYPRNSTLWATDPKTQICYTAVRRFANVAAPGLFMGVPFDRDEVAEYNAPIDVTPADRPRAEDYTEPEEPKVLYDLVDEVGEVVGSFTAKDFDKQIGKAINRLAKAKDINGLSQLMASNQDILEVMAKEGEPDRVASINEFYLARMQAVSDADKETPGPEPESIPAEQDEVKEEAPPPEPTEGEVEQWANETPTEFIWVSTNGRENKLDDLDRWVTSVSAALGRCPDVGMLDTSRKNNATTLAELHMLGGIYADAVDQVEGAFASAKEKLIG
jgi:hypothetical protein